MGVGHGRAWRQSLIRDLIEPVQSDEPASALGSHVQEFAFSGDVPGFRIISEGKGRSPISCGAGRRALMEDGDHWNPGRLQIRNRWPASYWNAWPASWESAHEDMLSLL